MPHPARAPGELRSDGGRATVVAALCVNSNAGAATSECAQTPRSDRNEEYRRGSKPKSGLDFVLRKVDSEHETLNNKFPHTVFRP